MIYNGELKIFNGVTHVYGKLQTIQAVTSCYKGL